MSGKWKKQRGKLLITLQDKNIQWTRVARFTVAIVSANPDIYIRAILDILNKIDFNISSDI